MPIATYHVVIIDDNPHDRAILRGLLLEGLEARLRIEEASSGEDGIRLCQLQPPDFLLLDMNLPGIHGMDVIRELQTEPGWVPFPIVALTGSGADLRCGKLAVREGAQDFLNKSSLSADRLARAIETCLERFQMARELRTQRDQLKQRESELQEATRQAAAANEAKSQFLAHMSHELRTPMTAILGFADMLSRELTEARLQEMVSTIRRNGTHLLELLNDILDLSKIEAGKLAIEPVPLDLIAFLIDLDHFARNRAQEKKLPFRVRLVKPIPQEIRSDPLRLRQILINLIVNAIKFTDAGHVLVNVGLEYLPEGATIVFDVEDTGVGMTPEQQNRLFRPFSQVDARIGQSLGGTGLGLSISKRLANMLDGDITCESEAGVGSKFTVRLPVQLDGSEELVNAVGYLARKNQARRGHPQAGAAPQVIKLPYRVLLADDRRDVWWVINHFLTQCGAEVTIVENGQDAVELLQESMEQARPFDCVLMDMQMPVMDGETATREIRRLQYRGPVIALTAGAMQNEEQKYLDAGCDEFFPKPINGPQLVETIARLVQEREAGV